MTSPTTPNTATPRWTKAAHVIVDWSNEASARSLHRSDSYDDDNIDDMELTMEKLMGWVRAYQERASVHVVLRRSFLESRNRELQRALQSLGCKVTMRSHQPDTTAFSSRELAYA